MSGFLLRVVVVLPIFFSFYGWLRVWEKRVGWLRPGGLAGAGVFFCVVSASHSLYEYLYVLGLLTALRPQV